MKRLTLEALEDRTVPAVLYSFLDASNAVLLSGTGGDTITVGTLAGNVAIDGVDTGVPEASVASYTLTGGTEANAFTLDALLTGGAVNGGAGNDALTISGGFVYVEV